MVVLAKKAARVKRSWSAGVFDDVDAALTWHPEAFAGMFNTRTLANIQASWCFKGIAAHAANSPHWDAAPLMP